jgi:hypothetical protein
MKMNTAGLYGLAFAVAFASGAWAVTSEREAPPPTQAVEGLRLAGSPASKAFGNPFKAPSDTVIDMEPTGSISTSGQTPPAAGDKTDAAPSVAAPRARKRN